MQNKKRVRRRSRTTKKLDEGQETPPVKPPVEPEPVERPPFPEKPPDTLTEGVVDWSSSWTEPRTITTDRGVSKEWKDPNDSTGRTCIPAVGDAIWIISGGVAKGNGSSPRMTVLGDYAGVESTVFVKGSKGNCEVRPKSDHYCVGECGDECFGGYNVNVNFDENVMLFKKEQSHAIGYSPRLAQKSVTLPKDKWFGLRGKVYNIGTKVKVEGWLNLTGTWKKISEFTDDGTIKCSDTVYPAYTANTKGSALRVNNADGNEQNGFEFKDWTIKKI